MYEFKLFDLIMIGVGAVLLIAFAASLVWSLAREKIRVMSESFDATVAHMKGRYKTQTEIQLKDLADAHNKLSLQLSDYDILYDNTKEYKECLEEWALLSFIDHKQPALALIRAIVDYEVKLALDPTVSKQAASLVNKSKRAFGKKLRAQHERELARVDKEWGKAVEGHRKTVAMIRTQWSEANFDHNLFIGALDETMEAKIALPGVRHSFRTALNANIEAKRKQAGL